MELDGFFTHEELLKFAGTKQKDSLERWLIREGIPYIRDAFGRPKVRYVEVEKVYNRTIPEQKEGA